MQPPPGRNFIDAPLVAETLANLLGRYVELMGLVAGQDALDALAQVRGEIVPMAIRRGLSGRDARAVDALLKEAAEATLRRGKSGAH